MKEMKTAIIFYSKHHGNTKKLRDAIAAECDVDLIDITADKDADLVGYDRIGIASGIYYSSFAKQVLEFAERKLPEGKRVFLISTCGSPRKNYFDAISKVVWQKRCQNIGTYECLGFDTFGPFKLVGGIAKGHPTEDEIKGAVEFYKSLK